MTGDVVNLRQARKARKRTAAEAAAAVNRASFGRTRGERMRQDLERDRSGRLLDGARRDNAIDDGG